MTSDAVSDVEPILPPPPPADAAVTALPATGPFPYGHPGHVPAPVTRRFDDVALVFEGGGMRATYTAALVRLLLEEGLDFGWVGGISAGGTHTVNFVARDRWRAREAFLSMPLDPQAGGWGSFVQGRGYFNSDHLYKETTDPGQPFPLNIEVFAASPAQVRIGAFCGDTGQEVYWGKSDLDTLEKLLPRAQASASMPLLMPPVTIDGARYYDGALGPTGGFATDAAQADGFERMLVVTTRPPGYHKEEVRSLLYRQAFRRQPLVADAIIARPARYNATMQELEERVRSGSVYLFQPDRMGIENGELRYDRLVSTYEAGMVQARRELPRILGFLEG